MNLKFKFNNVNFSVSCQYRSHDINADIFIENLNEYLQNINKSDVEVFLGDTNINILNCANNRRIKNEYLNTLYTHDFRSYMRGHFNNTGIDHCFIYNRSNLKIGGYARLGL